MAAGRLLLSFSPVISMCFLADLSESSIPTRRELVREAARAPTTSEVKVAIREHLEHHWSNCPLSNRKLHTPIVSDCIGNLYNRESILRFLLPGDEVEGIGSKAECEKLLGGRVKSLRDVVDVKFEVQDGDSADAKNNEKIGTNATNGDVQERFVCPITFKELGPNVKCVYLVPCGHAFSEEAIREMKSDRCLQVIYSFIPSETWR